MTNVLQHASDVYPMSDIQLGMVFHSLKHPEKGMYHDQFVYQLEDPLFNTELWRQAMTLMVEKHELLRTSFHMEEFSTPVQVVHGQIPICIDEIDSSSFIGDLKKGISRLLDEDRMVPFDLCEAPLWRMKVLRVDERHEAIIWIFHHAILDGWSVASFMTELVNVYFDLKKGPVTLEPLRSVYKDYVVDQMVISENTELADYWKKELEGYKRLPLPQQSLIQEKAGITILTEELDRTVIEQCKRLARDHHVPLKTLCLTAFLATMYSISYDQDVTVGLVENNRPISEDAEKMLGCFLNTVPFRVFFDQQISWKQLALRVYQKQVDLKTYGRLSFAKIAEITGERETDHNPIFDVIFNFVDFHVFEQVKGHHVQFWLDGYERTNTMLDFSVSTTLDHFVIRVVSILPEHTIRKIIGQYQLLLEMMVSRFDFDKPLDKSSWLLNADRELLSRVNETVALYPRDRTIHSLFEEQASLRPDQTAVVISTDSLSYKELNERANQLAHVLLSKGVQPDQAIGLITERSLDMIIAILAIFKAGGAYLPIDPSHPAERIRHMLADSQATLLIAQHPCLLPEGTGYEGTIILLSEQPGLGEPVYNPATDVQARHLAYVMYTSGSTGLPKGVMTTHRNVVKTVVNNGYLEITPGDRVLQLSNYAFDGSTFDIYSALLHGASLVMVAHGDLLDPLALMNIICEQQITVSFMTAALFNTLVEVDLEGLSRLRKLAFGGEQASRWHVEKALQVMGDGRLINGYGPTETTVFAATWAVDRSVCDTGVVPIGKPLNNTALYIVDRAGHLQPIGIGGELYVGGEGVARGYVNRPELTAERFVENPWLPGTQMYRTGDLARWLPDGTVEYMGRMDEQVKIRGHRIELGEIESRLLDHPAVREAVVTAARSGSGYARLCAYVVADGEWATKELSAHLKMQLPDYMIPASFVRLKQLPLTSNGKVDKRALPEPTDNCASEYSVPANEMEVALVSLFEDVLGVERIGTKDSFFEHGAHSLNAMTLVARIHKEFGVKVALRDIFEQDSIQALARLIQEEREKEASKAYRPIKPAPSQVYYPVTASQKQMYVVQQMEEENTVTSYHMPFRLELEGMLQTDKLRYALYRLVERHESLRTSFHMVQGELVQQIHKEPFWDMEEEEQPEQAVEKAVQAFLTPFDLGKAPLFRAKLIRVHNERHVLLLDMHHIISDGISVQILFGELARLYAGIEEFGTLHVQYKDYAVWQESFEYQEQLQLQGDYWLQALSGELPVLHLPTDFPRPLTRQNTGASFSFELSARLSEQLKELAGQEQTTLYTVLFAAFGMLLSKYTSQEDLIIGTPNAGRGHADVEQLVGMFVNTLAIRSRPEGQYTYLEYLSLCKDSIHRAHDYAEYPFEELVKKLDFQRDTSRNPLFDVMFSVEDLPQAIDVDGVVFRPGIMDWKRAKFDMDWIAVQGDQLQFMVEYDTSLFLMSTIERMAKHYIYLLEQIIAQPDRCLREYGLVTGAEKDCILQGFNPLDSIAVDPLYIHEQFEDWARRTPEHTAIVFQDNRMSYLTLNERANQLARKLRAAGVGRESIVGILSERSAELIIGVLAVWKAGGAYVPLDADYPPDRIQYMLQNSGITILLTQTALTSRVRTWQAEEDIGQLSVLCLDDEALYNGDASNLPLVNELQDLAYVIYTSGTTGRPKGVMIEHRGLSSTAAAYRQEYRLDQFPVRLLQLASFSFDVFVGDIARTLCNGGMMVICPQEDRFDAVRLYKWLRDYEITVFESTPALIVPFLEFIDNRNLDIEFIKLLITSSDSCSVHDYRAMQDRFASHTRLINSYGVTEASIDSSYYDEPLDNLPATGNVPIGRPWTNARFYIVDSYMNPVPVGVLGELCIAGITVARGYLNQPELTAEKFTVNPFVSGEKMYRTGDLAKWLPDGNVDFIGRIDYQVKIHGFRIELGEIEAAMLCAKGVRQAIVAVRTDDRGDKYLCGYAVGDDTLSTDDMHIYLKQELPAYMVPARLMLLEQLPLTANGKIDRKSLPEPQGTVHIGAEYVAPRNTVEQTLVSIWQEVMGVEVVGTMDNFFDLGGDSIKALQISARLSKFGLQLRMRDLFTNPTIAELGAYVHESILQAEQGAVTGPVHLTPVQRWFFNQRMSEPQHYNQSVILRNLDGWDADKVTTTMSVLTTHHDALRMRYSLNASDGQITQQIEGIPGEYFRLKIIDLTEHSMEEAHALIKQEATQIQAGIQLYEGSLVQLGLFRTKQGDYLQMAIHHLVVDGVSWRIILEDFHHIYDGNNALPLKTTSYLTWANELLKYSSGSDLAKEIPYWEQQADKSFQACFPEAREQHKGVFGDFETVSVTLTEEQTGQLLTQVHHTYRTEINDLLLTALVAAIRQWKGISKTGILLEGHGREDIIEGLDITRTVGWFTSEFPVFFELPSGDIPSCINHVKETLRAIPHKGIGYGVLKYITEHPLPDLPAISFNYLGQFKADAETSSELMGEPISLLNPNSLIIDINGRVEANRLHMVFGYNTKLFTRAQMEELQHHYHATLLDIIHHCLTTKDTVWTPDDFTIKGLSREELDDIFEDFEEDEVYQ
ncbi:non-ribosomal peptide synthetase [Paenibacillus terrae]|uniref:non-ribosomal peptide synthetase n=1 Tax=Paenibacillus terrae TaxID=159743 RepID=UPI0011EB0522|nr:non-ribosomal peptide synthetase [Paenibacillus terrae]